MILETPQKKFQAMNTKPTPKKSQKEHFFENLKSTKNAPKNICYLKFECLPM